jgi:hypothetical protein
MQRANGGKFVAIGNRKLRNDDDKSHAKETFLCIRGRKDFVIFGRAKSRH